MGLIVLLSVPDLAPLKVRHVVKSLIFVVDAPDRVLYVRHWSTGQLMNSL